MKLGLIDYKQRRSSADVIDVGLPGRLYRSEQAVYDQVSNLGTQIMEQGIRRSKRKAALEYKTEISNAQTTFEENDTLTKDDLIAMGVEEGTAGIDWSKDQFNTWEVQGPALAEIMRKGTDKAAEAINIPGARSEFKDELEDANIRILEAARKDAHAKWEKFSHDEEVAEAELIINSDPAGVSAWLENTEHLSEREKESVRKASEVELAGRWATDIILSGDLLAIEQAQVDIYSDEKRGEWSRLDETKRTAISNRLKTAANALEANMATGELNQANLAIMDFERVKWGVDQKLANGMAQVDKFSTAENPFLDTLGRDIQQLELHTQRLMAADADRTTIQTQINTINDLKKEYDMARAKQQINAMPYDTALEYIDTQLDDYPEAQATLRSHLKARQSAPALDVLIETGVITSPEELANPGAVEAAREFTGSYAISTIPSKDIEFMVGRLEDPTTPASVKRELYLTLGSDPNLMTAFGAIDSAEKKRAAAIATAPAHLQAAMVRGALRKDISGEVDEKLWREEFIEQYNTMYADNPMQFEVAYEAARLLARGHMVESTDDFLDLAEDILPKVARVGTKEVLVDPSLDPGDLEDYVDNLTANSFGEGGLPRPYNMTAEQAAAIAQRAEWVPAAGGYNLRINGQYVLKDSTGARYLIPYGEEQAADGKMLSPWALRMKRSMSNGLIESVPQFPEDTVWGP